MNSEILDRPPPHDLAAERAVIGSALIDPKVLAEVGPALRPEDFHNDRHVRLFRHIVGLWNNGEGAVDITLLQSAMRNNGGWTDEDAAGVAELFQLHPNPSDVQHYAKIVRDKAESRRVIHVALEIVRDGYNGVAPAVLRQRIECAMERIDADGGVDFQPMTLAELMARDVAVEYLIDNLIASRQPILLAGPVKSLKTSILLDLCFALATGGHFLGYFRILRSIAVAVLTGESGLPTVKDTLARIGRAANIDPAGVTRLIVSDRIPHLSSLEHLDALRRLILDYELELLAIDPAYLALDGTDAANVMVFGQQLRAVSELCQEMGVALLLCHHTKKGSGIDGQPLALTDAAWSGFAEHARQWLLINHREPFDQESGTARLWLSGGGSAGHSGLWAVDVHQGRISDSGGREWDVSVSTPNEAHDAIEDRREHDRAAKVQTAVERDADKVLRVLAKLADGATKNAIRDRAGLSGARATSAVDWLLEESHIIETTIQVSNHRTPQAGYKLAESKDQT
jgi:hypothetical protein